MHELSVTEGILKITVEEAAKYKAKKVSVIRIKMGVLSDLLPDSINYYFEIISRNTIAEGAKLEVERLPMKVSCNDCGNISQIEIRSRRCPCCSSQNLKIIQGNEFYIDSLEVE